MVIVRDPNEEKGDFYDTMQVCIKNGHKITERYDTEPNQRQNHCQLCGSKTTATCLKCGTKIRGYHHYEYVAGVGNINVPRNCHNCGAPYPWSKKLGNTNAKNLSSKAGVTPKLHSKGSGERRWFWWIMGIGGTIIAGLILAFVFGVGR